MNKKKIQAIRKLMFLAMFILVNFSNAYFLMYAVEKYFM